MSVDGDLEAIGPEQLRTFDAFIVPSGMVSDRLRYTEDVSELAPAVRLLGQAFATPGLLKGIICHGMWLAAPIPEVIRGRRVTCHNNLIGDVRNMGAQYTDQDVVVDGDLVTARSAGHCHLFARMIIDLLAARQSRAAVSPAAAPRALVATTAEPAAAEPTTSAKPVASAAAEPAAATSAEPATSTPASAGANGVNRVDFPFSDLVAGYVTSYDPGRRLIDMRTSDGSTGPSSPRRPRPSSSATSANRTPTPPSGCRNCSPPAATCSPMGPSTRRTAAMPSRRSEWCSPARRRASTPSSSPTGGCARSPNSGTSTARRNSA
jgi:hypothetical protein